MHDVRDKAGNLPQDKGYFEIGIWCANGNLVREFKANYENSQTGTAAIYDKSTSNVIVSDPSMIRRGPGL